MADAPPLAGGCLCGAIRYRIDEPVLSAGICHCVSCRRAAGAESVGWLTVPAAALVVRGAPATFASSPGVTRGFCRACGTTLTWRRDGEATVDVTAATLDDPERAPVSAEWWLAHRVAWNAANPDLAAFAESGPPDP